MMNKINRFLIQATCTLVGLFIFASCAKGPEKDIEHNIFVTHASLNMIEGDEIQITASPTTQTFTWESTNSAIATISSTGMVRAIADGQCNINVASSEGLKRTIPVNVVKYLPLESIYVINTINLQPVKELSLLLNRPILLEAIPEPYYFNERIPFDITWHSSAPDIISVDELTGLVTAIDFGDAVITATVVDKPAIKAEVTISTAVIPITDIQVSASKVYLLPGKNATINTVFSPSNYSVPDVTLQWESSNNSVVTAVNGVLEGIGEGTATVTVSWNGDHSVNNTIAVTVSNSAYLDFSIFASTEFYAGDNSYNDFVYSKIDFIKGNGVEIVGMTATEIEAIYNRDLFEYDPVNNKLTFTGETGFWDVYYSKKYNYIWVIRNSDLRPDCNWIMGANFSSAPVWHSDFGGGNYSGERLNPKNRAYMVKISDNVYQAHVLLDRSWFAIMMVRGWELVNGDWDSKVYAPGLTIVGAPLNKPEHSEMDPGDGFVPGYYKITYDANNAQLELEKVD